MKAKTPIDIRNLKTVKQPIPMETNMGPSQLREEHARLLLEICPPPYPHLLPHFSTD